jgi:Protein of unknown function (DUF2809)
MMALSERTLLLGALAVIVPVGFFVKFWVPGPLQLWCSSYGAAVLYEIFWILVLRLVALRLAPLKCGMIVLIVTCLLEFAQLWHPPFLEAIRNTFIGAALIGTTFDPWDFSHYVIGSVLGVLLALAIQCRSTACQTQTSTVNRGKRRRRGHYSYRP